ncbi:MAG TPA: replication initiator protein A [Pyrinomonadaceae bacterium]|nr:replication initiator protein A [Pyrinomonadaceae bacterium]
MKVAVSLKKREALPPSSVSLGLKRKSPVDNQKEKSDITLLPAESEIGRKFIGIEKDLFTIGFFSAPKYSHAKKTPKQEKRVRITSFADSGIETTAEILTHARYGLPTTGDLTKYLALLQIVHERHKMNGMVENPVQFTHYELLQKAGLAGSKSAHDEVTEWLERLDNTQIIISGLTKDNSAEEKRLYKLFNEVHLSGRTDREGRKIKFNSIWLSDWAIKNICVRSQLPVDLGTYQKLKNDVAKLLVFHLQIWLYASRGQAYFEKFYSRFCELLDLKEKKSRSEIIRQLTPALNELKKYEYISNWKLVPGSTGSGLKIKIWRGAKFLRDLKKGALAAKDFNNQNGPKRELTSEKKTRVLRKLTGLGIYQDLAEKLLEKFSLEMLELRIERAVKEFSFKQKKEKVNKPGGLLYKIISSDEASVISGSERYDEHFEINDKSSNEVCDIDESSVDKEFEKTKWLETQFEKFCLTEALKKPQLDFNIFAESFQTGREIFNKFMERMQGKVGKHIYQSWFETICFAGYKEGVLFVAGGEVNRDWVVAYYEKTVKEVFEKMNLPDFRLEWLVLNSIPPLADVDFYYLRHLINNYQSETKATVEDFYKSSQSKLDVKFECYLDDF